jgi:hypothetical protein
MTILISSMAVIITVTVHQLNFCIIVLTEAYSKSYKSAIRAEMIKASSSTEDGSTTTFTQQRSLYSRNIDSQTNTMVNTSSEFPSPYYLHQSPVSSSQLRSVTFLPSSSSRNDLTATTCKISEPLTRDKCGEARKQVNDSSDGGGGGGENNHDIAALSRDILRHTEILQSLLNSLEDNEIQESVSLLSLAM